jgi:hypothetical protein
LITTGARVPPVTAPPATPAGNAQVLGVVAVQVGGGTGAPLIVWPQVGTLWPVGVEPAVGRKQLTVGASALPVLNALAASPGRMEM